jgi:hypothetical protein
VLRNCRAARGLSWRRGVVPLNPQEALFDAADGRVEQIRARSRKGALAALRDATVLKTVYAYGLFSRVGRREARGLDLADLRHNPKAPQYGRCGGLFVRWGKACKGTRPRRRTVLTVPEMDWIKGVLEHWISEVRPVFGPGSLAALWVTERASRIAVRAIDDAFTVASKAAGLPAELNLHCLRHFSWVTALINVGCSLQALMVMLGHTSAAMSCAMRGCSTAPSAPTTNARSPRAAAPTLISASTAPASAPMPRSCRSWPPSAPTPRSSSLTPKPAAGEKKQPATSGSSNDSTSA